MSKTIRAKIVKIGNSHGIRIPHVLLEQAGLYQVVEMRVERDSLIIHSVREARQGWGAQFAEMAKNQDDILLDQASTTHWDDEEWEWE